MWQLKHFTSLFQWSHQDQITPKVLVSEERGMKYLPRTHTQLKIMTVIATQHRQCEQCSNNATNIVSQSRPEEDQNEHTGRERR